MDFLKRFIYVRAEQHELKLHISSKFFVPLYKRKGHFIGIIVIHNYQVKYYSESFEGQVCHLHLNTERLLQHFKHMLL